MTPAETATAPCHGRIDTLAAAAVNGARDRSRGLALGVLGVVIFAMTLPMTRLAVGDASDAQLAPLSSPPVVPDWPAC